MVHPIEAAVADQMERDHDDAVRDVRQMMARIRRIPREIQCDNRRCGQVLERRHMSNVGTLHAPRWLCPDCMWTRGN